MIDSNVINNITTDSDILNIEADVAIKKANGTEQLVAGKLIIDTINLFFNLKTI